MQLKLMTRWVVLSVLVCGCGPNVAETPDEDWMQGWFSLRHPSDALTETYDSQLFLNSDGEASLRKLDECGSSDTVTPMEWSVVDASTVRVRSDTRHYLIRKLAECDQFDRVRVLDDGTELDAEPLHAGQICMTRGEASEWCTGSGCTVCYKNWCEGEEPTSTCEES